MEEKAPINQEQLQENIDKATNKQKATCKSEVKWSRSMVRAELEELDILNRNVELLKQINTTLAKIGQPAIAYYFEIMSQKLAEEKKAKSTHIEKDIQ